MVVTGGTLSHSVPVLIFEESLMVEVTHFICWNVRKNVIAYKG